MTTTHAIDEIDCPFVPASYIKNAKYDGDGEIYAAMGGCLPICGDFLVKPPSLGVYSLLETYESRFISDPINCSIMDFWRTLYINEHRRQCIQDVMDWAYPSKGSRFKHDDQDTWSTLDWLVYNWGVELHMNIDDEMLAKEFARVYDWFALAFTGFEMIPSSGGGNEYWFGAEAIGNLSAAIGETTDRILWDIPMCAVGHKLAATCRMNGDKNVKRPKCREDMRKQFAAARERVLKGEMHPWQIDNPEAWPLTPDQKKYAPHLEAEWEALVEEKK